MYKLYTFFDGCNVLVLLLQHFTFVLNQIALTTMKRMLNRMLRFCKIKAASFFRRVTRLLKKTTRLEAAEKCPDAGRVAPIRACVFYQIDRLKSGFEALGRTVMPENCALMGATRPASGKVQLLFSRACILFFHYPDAGRVAPISACVSSSTKLQR